MNSETLERLLIDRALGAMNPDVEALVAHYLETDSEAAREAAALRETVELAAKILRHPVPAIELPGRQSKVLLFPGVKQTLALAASFTTGALLALGLLRPHTVSAPVSVASSSSIPAAETATIQALPFWSDRRAYLIAEAARQNQNVQTESLK